MRILSWLQCKFTGEHEKRVDVDSSSIRRTNSSELHNEFIDSLPPLLAIGTFGTDDLSEEAWRFDGSKNICSPDTPEEVVKLQRDLTNLLACKTKLDEGSIEQNDEEDNADLSPDNKIILNRVKGFLSDNCGMIKQKSTSFLLGKMFICRGGFAVTPKFKDPVAESIVEKFFKALLHKKVYPQHPAPTQRKKYLKKNSKEKAGFKDHEMNRERENGGRWVRTDSEYIVLEMKARHEV